MKTAAAILILIPAMLLAQTPFEFSVVEDLVGGEPHISVLRMEIIDEDAAPRTLRIAARAGVYVTTAAHALSPDRADQRDVLFEGKLCYDMAVPLDRFYRILEVVRDNIQDFPGMGIEALALDLISTDDMSWVSIDMTTQTMDDILQNRMTQLDFWRQTEIGELEISTCRVPPSREMEDVFGELVRTDTVEVTRTITGSAHAWKSLLLPGWGQLASGRGLGWINLAAEAGGVALILSDYQEAGAAVLGLNHLISFTDLL